MGKTIEEIIAAMPPEQQARVHARADEMIAEATLQELRKALRKTQAAMAKDLGVTQDNVSRMEKRGDVLVSTLRKAVEALGGRLSIVAEFPDRPPVRLTGVGAEAPPSGS